MTWQASQWARRAIGDEWLAQVQYWLEALNIDDENEDAVSEFIEHEHDEWDHATELAAWLRSVPGCGKLPRSIREITAWQHCGYVFPSGYTREALVGDAIKGEKCAIEFYERYISLISGKMYSGPDLGEILEQILAKEKEHLRDLEKL